MTSATNDTGHGNPPPQSSTLNSILVLYCQNAAATGQKLDKLMQLLCSSLQPDGSIGIPPSLQRSNNRKNSVNEEECTRFPAANHRSSRISDNSNIDLFELLNDENHQDDVVRVEDVILIMGNTGCGKTTVTQILAEDLTRLHAVLSDSGKLFIIDDDNKIGGPSTVSKTLMPELVIQKVNDSSDGGGTAFYDCPGFDDTRGADVDIAANFFMHRVLKKVKRLKILFLVNYSSVKMGNERVDFDLLASHVSRFLRSLRRYRDSFALVVTKTPSYSESGDYLEDDEIISGIVEFLSVYNQTLHDKLQNNGGDSTAERGEITKKIFFVETLLEMRHQRYTKISFSRSPEKCGPLSDSRTVGETRQRLMTLYENELEYTPVDIRDFGYTLKDKTVLNVMNCTGHINAGISKSVAVTLEDFQTWYWNTVHLTLGPLDISNHLQNVTTSVKTLIRLLSGVPSSNSNLSSFSEHFIKFLEQLGYSVPEKFNRFVGQQQSYFEFFSDATNARQSLESPQEWIVPLTRFQRDMSELQEWYHFLASLKQHLGSYTFQGRLKPAIVKRSPLPRSSDPFAWLEFIQNEDIVTVQSGLVPIARKIERRHYAFLDKLLRFYLEPIQISCSANKVTIKGNLVSLNEFLDKSGQIMHDNLAECPHDSIELLEVYASDTVFIDGDIDAEGREMNVLIIAPKWVIIGNRKFNLNGKEGSAHWPTSAENGVTPWYLPGTEGMDGVAGKSGGPGGSLFGIYLDISEEFGGSLTITSNGGKGGTGQDGGHGGNGAEGDDGKEDAASVDKWFTLILVHEYKKSHEGYPGKPGGNGGNGGVGGFGGLPGKVEIASGTQGRSDLIHVIRESGPRGDLGKAGVGGRGGVHGRKLSCTYTWVLLVIKVDTTCSRYYASMHPDADDGNDGIEGISQISLGSPEVPRYFIVEWRHALNYKIYFYSLPNIRTTSFIRFLDQSTEPPQKYHVHTLKQFAEELAALQKLGYPKTGSDNLLVKLYESFILRGEKFARKVANSEDSEKKVVQILLAHAYNSLTRLKGSSLSHQGMVVDVLGYFGLVKIQLNRFRQSSALQMVQETRRDFENKLMEKIEDARQFISAVLRPALDTAQVELQFRLKSLEKQFEFMVNDAEQNLNISRESLKSESGPKFLETLELKQVFGVLKIASKVLFFLGYPDIASGVDVGLSFVETFSRMAQNKNGQGETDWGAEITDKAKHLINLLSGSNETSNSQDFDSGEMVSSSFELTTLQPNEFEGRGLSNNGTSLQDTLLYLVGPTVAYSLYHKFQNDQGKRNKLEQAVHDAEKLLADTLRKQKFLGDSFIPLVQSMLDYAGKVQGHLASRRDDDGTISSWQLGMAKLDIQGRLRSIKLALEGLGAKIQSRIFQGSLNKIQDLITMMIDMYDSIEEYGDTRNLANYMATLHSASLGSVAVTSNNSEVTHLVTTLEKSVQENTLNRQVQQAFHAFKMWVFPFAKLYLAEFWSNPGVQVFQEVGNRSVESTTEMHLRQIDQLQDRLERYKAMTVNSHDTHVIHTNFTSAHKSSRPFYVWRWDRWSSKIMNLLAGKQVHLKADVRHGHQGGRNAVKFKQIEINFKLKDPSDQLLLNEELEHFSVSLTHGGLNYFKFRDEYFVITSSSGNSRNHTIMYHFERDQRTGGRLGTNLLYEKFKKGDFLLSPYTLWTVQISKAFPSQRVTFEKLRKFGEKGVDVELVGTGIYIDERREASLGDLEVERYYEKDDSLREERDFSIK